MALTKIDFNDFSTTGEQITEKRADGLFMTAINQNIDFHQSSQPLTFYITLPKRFMS